MSEENQPILPLLKDSAWQYHEQSVCRRLASELESPYLPFVSFGYDNPHTFQFLPEEGGAGRNIAVIERCALENLRKLFPAKWERHNLKIGPFQKLSMLLCGDNFFQPSAFSTRNLCKTAPKCSNPSELWSVFPAGERCWRLVPINP